MSILLNGNRYQLCLLDTNVISEIVKNKNNMARNFIKNIVLDENYVPCFCIESILEIRKKAEVYDKFLEIFSVIPIFLLKQYGSLINQEISGCISNSKSILLNSFSVLGKDKSSDIKYFFQSMFDDPEFIEIESNWRKQIQDYKNKWAKNKRDLQKVFLNPDRNEQFISRLSTEYGYFPKNFLKYYNLSTAKHYVNIAGKDVIQETLNLPDKRYLPDIDNFPMLKTSLFLQYFHLFDPSREIKLNDIVDIIIVSPAPMCEMVITDKNQASILSKIKNEIPGLQSTSIMTIKNLRG